MYYFWQNVENPSHLQANYKKIHWVNLVIKETKFEFPLKNTRAPIQGRIH